MTHHRRERIGELQNIPDRVLLKIFSFLDPKGLLNTTAVCWTFFVFANADELWRDLVLLLLVDDDKIARFTFKGSWKATMMVPRRLPVPAAATRPGDESWKLQNIRRHQCQICVTQQRWGSSSLTTPFPHASWLHSSSSINFLTSKGEYLLPPPYAAIQQKEHYRFYNVCGYDMRTLPMNTSLTVDRRRPMSREEFKKEYEIPNKPVIITGLMEKWPASEKWKLKNLCASHPNIKLKTNSRSTNGKRFRIALYDFLAYCEGWNGEKPLYVFDKKVIGPDSEFVKDYTVPEYFTEDLFELMEEEDRPDYRWILLGPNGSATPFHVDPHNSSAWNAVIEGAKRVSFYPPDVVPPGVDEELIHSDYYPSEDAMDWYRNIYPTLPPEKRPMECVVEAGEILFIPSGWWHQVQNIGHTMAVTQNYCSLVTFPRVAADMNAHAGKSVRKDFKIALSESEEYKHLADHIVVNKKSKRSLSTSTTASD